MDNISKVIESVEKILLSEKKIPVSFREFVCGKDYCDDSDIYQFWIDEEKKIPKKCSELIIDGSLGGGKSTFSAYYTAYRVYIWFLNGDPRKELGIAQNSDLYGFYFSVSLKMAEKSGFKLLYNVFKNCKWFKENMPMNTELKSSIQFPAQRFQIDYASAETHQTGLNVIIFILDEANFRGGVGTGVAQEYEEVTFLYSQLLDRLVTRFGRPDGTVDALAMLISSASYQSAFAEQRRAAVENDPNAHHIRAVGYKIKPQNYSKETFTVFSGTATQEPRIVKTEEQKQQIIQALGMEGTGLAEKYFLQVPVSIKRFFETNINLALQNHCGVPTQIKGRFLQDINILRMNYYQDEPDIFSQNIISLSNGDDIQLADYLILQNIMYPERPHSLFLDLSITGDSGGFSCFRFDGEKDNVRYHTHVFTLEIVPPPPPHQTRISKYRQFMSEFAQIVNVVAFGTDQFQCLIEGTWIPTTNGLKKIEDLRQGDELFSHNGLTKVKKVFSYSEAPVVKVTTRSGVEMIITPNHKISTLRWIKSANDSQVYDSVLRLSKRRENDKNPVKLVRMFKVPEVGDCIEVPKPMIIGGNVSDKERCEAMVIGWMIGDGGVTNGIGYVTHSLEELDIQDYFKNIVDGFGNCDTETVRASYTMKLLKNSKLNRFITSLFGNRCSALEKFIPDELMKKPKDYIDFLLKGLYSADGSCTEEQIVLTSSSKKLLMQVKQLLSVHYGINTSITKSKRGYKGDFGNNPCYHLRTKGDVRRFLEIGFIQEYKVEALKKTLGIKGKGFFDKVISIEPFGEANVYDVEVDNEDHSYYTCDCLTHNSSGLRQDVHADLGLTDTRLSIDSSDLPHLQWVRGLVEKATRMRQIPKLELEVIEAEHDLKRRRVVKKKGSTDDLFQSAVGAYWLSDTVGPQAGDISNLTDSINLVGAQSYKRVLKKLGYKVSKR